MDGSIRFYVLLVTDGVVLEYPPELYDRYSRARLEAERWAWILSGTGWLEIRVPFDDRWAVGDRDVRLVPVTLPEGSSRPLWIGQYWTEDGIPDPEAQPFATRAEAAAWVFEPMRGQSPTEVTDRPWFLAATFRFSDDDEAYAVASLVKFVTDRTH